MRRLPDAEFDVMKAVWALEPPITAGRVLEQLSGAKRWRVQTVITLLGRLVEHGFLQTEKKGKERTYAPLVGKEEYLRFETGCFIEQYHESSLTNLVSTLYGGKQITDEDVDELLAWAKQQKEGL